MLLNTSDGDILPGCLVDAILHCFSKKTRQLWQAVVSTNTLRGRSRRGQRRDPQYGPPTADGVLYILHMGDGTIPTVRNN